LIGLFIAAFGAGLIDSMVGGGGLIQIPALFGLMPGVNHATLLGTNKISSVVGTTFAAVRYAKIAQMPWNSVLPAAVTALVGAFIGAYIVTQVSSQTLRMFLPLLLLLVAIYTFLNKNLGSVNSPKWGVKHERWMGVCIGFVIGLYDGFFGPGTGSFLMVAFVVLCGYDFLRATAGAKVVNIACNVAALAWFAPSGHVLVALGLAMAVFNLLGAHVGTALAIRKGAGFIRQVLLAVVFVLICKTSYDSYGPYLSLFVLNFGLLLVSRGT
jgi:uncharacterized membrane protein YfcA